MTNARGIDVSSANGSIARIIPALDFCIVRATVGTKPDLTYRSHAHDTLMAGKVLGAYHWPIYGPGPTRQAAAFLAVATNAAFLCVDDEGLSLHHPTLIRGIIANLHKLDTQRRRVLLYASDGNYPGDLGQDANWIADWGGPVDHPWLFHQYSNGGGKLDRDEFHGTNAQLIAWSHGRR